MEGRPPCPQSRTWRGGAKSPLHSPEARTEQAPAATGGLSSPSLTPHKRSSVLGRTGREGDSLINPTAEMVVHQSPPPITLPDLSSNEGSANKQSLPESSAYDQGEDPFELCLALERLSGSESPRPVVMGVHDAQPDRSRPQTNCVRGSIADDTAMSVGPDTGSGDPAAGTSAAWSGESLAQEWNSGRVCSTMHEHACSHMRPICTHEMHVHMRGKRT
jgi:hypothetical protein